MDKPLVSVIVPVYNTGESVKKTIDSILGNTYENFEIIVVNDGSTDNTGELLNKIKSAKVKIYNKKNGGPSSARNFGIEKSKGEYLLFVDSDDEIKPEFVEKLVEAMKSSENILAMTGVAFRNSSGEKNEFIDDFTRKDSEDVKTYMLRSLLDDGRMYPVFNKIFRAEIVKKNVKFDEKMRFGEDTKFVLDYVSKIGGEILLVSEPLYIHHMNTKTSVAKSAEVDWQNWQKCYRNLKKWVGKKNSFSEKMLLKLIYLKWRVSWLKARIS